MIWVFERLCHAKELSGDRVSHVHLHFGNNQLASHSSAHPVSDPRCVFWALPRSSSTLCRAHILSHLPSSFVLGRHASSGAATSVAMTTSALRALAGERSRSDQLPVSPLSKVAVPYSDREVARHSRRDDCWVIVDGEVYDVSKWVPRHPGGDILMVRAGMDCSQLFESYHPSAARYSFATASHCQTCVGA